MLVIKVELWPFGDQSRSKEIGSAKIANIGGNYTDGFDYKAILDFEGVTSLGIEPINKEVVVRGHDRRTPLPGLIGKVFSPFILKKPKK